MKRPNDNIQSDNRKPESEVESVDDLAPKAPRLNPIERIRLVEAVLHSTDKPDDEIENSRIREAEERYEAFKDGKLPADEWGKMKKKYDR